MSAKKEPFHKSYILKVLGSTITGAVVLSLFSLIQKIIISAPIGMQGFIIPFIFGGICGYLLFLWAYRLMQANVQLKQSVQEKEILLRELHHRVKNNLQLVSSICSLSSFCYNESPGTCVVDKIESRINLLAHTYEVLYDDVTHGRLRICDFLESIIVYIQDRFYNVPVEIHSEMDELYCECGKAVPMSMIIFEIISNSYRHAFTAMDTLQDRKNKIGLTLKHSSPGNLQLTIFDNGVGFSFNKKLEEGKTLGLQLIDALARQMSASMEFNGTIGTEYRFIFPQSSLLV